MSLLTDQMYEFTYPVVGAGHQTITVSANDYKVLQNILELTIDLHASLEDLARRCDVHHWSFDDQRRQAVLAMIESKIHSMVVGEFEYDATLNEASKETGIKPQRLLHAVKSHSIEGMVTMSGWRVKMASAKLFVG